MKKWVVKLLLIGTLLLLGALFGIQQMSEQLGISQPEPLLVEKVQTNNTDVNTSERTPYVKNELLEKKQKVEEIGRFNFFSDMGNFLATGMNQISRGFLSQIMVFVDQVLNGQEEDI